MIKNNEDRILTKRISDEERKRRIYMQRLCRIILRFVIGTIICIAVFIFFKEANEIKNVFFTYNILEQLNYMYKGNFTIISPQIDENANVTPNGLYTVKAENGIVFCAYKSTSILKTDYAQYLYKKYVLDYIEKNKDANIIYEDLTQEYMNTALYYFKFGIRIDSYSKIENAVDELYKLCQYINKKAKKDLDFEATFYTPYIFLNDFEGQMTQDITNYNVEYYINKIKIDYVNYLITNSISDENVTYEDILKFYRPQELKIYVNDNLCTKASSNGIFECKAQYNINESDYCINMFYIIDLIDSLENYERNYNGALENFVYNGKKYYFDGRKKKISRNKVPYQWTMKMLQDFFGADINYDLKNEIVKINI